MAVKLKDYKNKKMQDPEFAKAYVEMQPEMNVTRALIETDGMGMVLNVTFTPKDAAPEFKKI